MDLEVRTSMGVVVRPVSSWYLLVVFCGGTCRTRVLCLLGHSDGPTPCSALVLFLVGHSVGPTHCPALPPVLWVPWDLATCLLFSDYFSTWWSCFSTSPYAVCHVCNTPPPQGVYTPHIPVTCTASAVLCSSSYVPW